jgi:general secretion pathway protein K
LMTVHEPDLVARSSARDGFIIVAVLWILIALATLASVYSIYVSNSALALTVMDKRLQAEQLVSASLELTAYRLAVPKDNVPKDNIRPTRGQFAFRLERANVVVKYSSETARLDLNAAPKPLLAGFLISLGVPNDNADHYADRIIGWRKPPSPTDQGNEAALYRSTGLSYLPRSAPFAHTSELWLVQGLPPALVRRAIPFVTVFSGRPDINVFNAAPELVAALPGMTPARLATFLNQRETAGANKDSLERLLGPGQPGATAEGSSAFRVTIEIAFHDGWRTGSEVVILLDTADEPFQVLSWRNDVGADLDQPQLAKRLR